MLLLLMPLAGRCALVIMMASLPYARPEGGLATLFKASCALNHALKFIKRVNRAVIDCVLSRILH